MNVRDVAAMGTLVVSRLQATVAFRVILVRSTGRKKCSSCGNRRVARTFMVADAVGTVVDLGPWLCRECADAPA